MSLPILRIGSGRCDWRDRDQSHGLVRMVGVVDENFEVGFIRRQIALVPAHVIADCDDLMSTRLAVSLQAESDWGTVVEKRSQFLQPTAVAALQTPIEKFAIACAARVEAKLRPSIEIAFDGFDLAVIEIALESGAIGRSKILARNAHVGKIIIQRGVRHAAT